MTAHYPRRLPHSWFNPDTFSPLLSSPLLSSSACSSHLMMGGWCQKCSTPARLKFKTRPSSSSAKLRVMKQRKKCLYVSGLIQYPLLHFQSVDCILLKGTHTIILTERYWNWGVFFPQVQNDTEYYPTPPARRVVLNGRK